MKSETLLSPPNPSLSLERSPVSRGQACTPDCLLHVDMRVRVSRGSGKVCTGGAHGPSRSVVSTLVLQHGDPAQSPHWPARHGQFSLWSRTKLH